MAKEVIFNIFPICKSDIITEVGFRVHEFEGSDDEKTNFLLTRVETDFKEMVFIKISDDFKVLLADGEEVNGLTHERYNNFLHNGTESILYEPIFQLFNAPKTPLSVSTMVVDGKIYITQSKHFDTMPKTNFTEKITEKIPNHYLKEFTTEDGFDMGALINSDFIVSIRLLFQNQKYVSCVKLLMSAIDTFAFLEFGDVDGNFKKWVSRYCDLSSVGVSEIELWAYRNSIIHMTNSYSRQVIKNKVQKLSFYVNKDNVDYLTTDGEAKYFNLLTLINSINKAIEKWCDSYNDEREKFEPFCDRYDLIISDSRYGTINE
jgi:hypothetical protein